MNDIKNPEIRFVIYPTRLDGQLIGIEPRMRHLEGCGHFKWPDGSIHGTTVLATDEQMLALSACKHCVNRKGGRVTSSGRHGEGRIGEPCPNCNMALPLTGICDDCD